MSHFWGSCPKQIERIEKELKKIKTMIQKFQKEREVDREKIIGLEKRIVRLEIKVGI